MFGNKVSGGEDRMLASLVVSLIAWQKECTAVSGFVSRAYSFSILTNTSQQ